VKHFKDLQTCIALLHAAQARSDIEPEQKKYIENAIEEAKRLRRRPNAERTESFRCVRRITENLLAAFIRD
jgi:hypothetical protein